MKIKKTTSIAVFVLLLMSIVVIPGCSNSDMARVTINLGIPSQAKAYVPTLFDRIVALISFSSRAQADSVDNSPTTLTTVSITVELGSMQIASLEIAPGSTEWNTGTAAFDVPAGGPCVITVVGSYKNLTGGPTQRLMGGISTIDSISGGSDISVPINMGYLPTSADYSLNSNGMTCSLSFTLSRDSDNVTGFLVYKTLATNGGGNLWIPGDFIKFSEVRPAAIKSPVTVHDPDMVTGSSEASQYRVVPYNQYGEGDYTEITAEGGC